MKSKARAGFLVDLKSTQRKLAEVASVSQRERERETERERVWKDMVVLAAVRRLDFGRDN
jgi:hypothetical protein